MQPDESEIWAGEMNVYPNTGSPPNNVLASRFPELVNAGGAVDPAEALVSLMDRIKDLEARINGTN